MLIYCSADPAVMGTGNYVDAWRAHHENSSFPTGTQSWANAFYTYWPGDIGSFNAQWQAFVSAYPQGVPVLASPKGRPDTTSGANALHSFCSQVPAAWKSEFIMAYWQEPGNNFGGDGQPTIAEYRNRVAAMSDIVRSYGLKNAVHVEEWDINPFNNRSGSTQAERFAHLAQFVQGIEDKIDVVSWSLYPAPLKSMVPGIDLIEQWMGQYMPDHEWRITATAAPVLVGNPLGSAERVLRANLVREAGDYIAARTAVNGKGPHSFGWFHFSDFGGNNRDNLATTDPLLYDALQYVAALGVPEPPGPITSGFVDSSQSSTIGASSLNIAIPSTVQNGDVALLFVDCMTNTAEATVAGWSLVGRAVGSRNISSSLFARHVTGSQGSQTVTIGLSESDIRCNAQMVVYRDVSVDDIKSQWTLQSGSTDIVTPTFSVGADSLVVEHVVERGNPVGSGFTPPSGRIERLDGGPTFAGVSVRSATSDMTLTQSGLAGGGTWTSTASTNHQVAWTVAFSSESGRQLRLRQAGAWTPLQKRLRSNSQWV